MDGIRASHAVSCMLLGADSAHSAQARCHFSWLVHHKGCGIHRLHPNASASRGISWSANSHSHPFCKTKLAATASRPLGLPECALRYPSYPMATFHIMVAIGCAVIGTFNRDTATCTCQLDRTWCTCKKECSQGLHTWRVASRSASLLGQSQSNL